MRAFVLRARRWQLPIAAADLAEAESGCFTSALPGQNEKPNELLKRIVLGFSGLPEQPQFVIR